MLENEWWVTKMVECECRHVVGLENGEINTQNRLRKVKNKGNSGKWLLMGKNGW